MNLTMKPTDIMEDVTSISYIETPLFRYTFTKRNWYGDKYIPKSNTKFFSNDLDSYTLKLESDLHLDLNSIFKIHYLIDNSVLLYKPLSNEKLNLFIESLNGRQLDGREEKKVVSLFRSYINKIENMPQILKWCIENKNHAIQPLVYRYLHDYFDLIHNSFMKKTVRRIDTKNPITNFEAVMKNYSRKEEEITEKFMSYATNDPELFVYATYWVNKWFHSYFMKQYRSEFIICINGTKNGCHIEVFQGQDFPRTCLFFEEFFGHYEHLLARELFYSITNINILEFAKEVNLEDSVLRSIALWALKEIQYKRKYKLPSFNWYTDIEWSTLSNLGLKQISLLFEKEVVNENNETSTLVCGKLNMGYGLYIIFPLIHPEYWDQEEKPLNIQQKLLITYALCLYRDIVVENAFDEIKDGNEEHDPNDFFLPEKANRLSFTGRKLGSLATFSNEDTNDRRIAINDKKHSSHKSPKEHWVAFHFRQLGYNRKASTQAIEKAEEYGINVPEGFTFVDAFVRGGNELDIDMPTEGIKISSIEIFKRTLEKLL